MLWGEAKKTIKNVSLQLSSIRSYRERLYETTLVIYSQIKPLGVRTITKQSKLMVYMFIYGFGQIVVEMSKVMILYTTADTLDN